MEIKFDYISYIYLLKNIKKVFPIYSFRDVYENEKILKKKGLLLRHDVDVSLKKALSLGVIEKSMDIKSTFFIMINNPFYKIEDKKSKNVINNLLELGHDIGLHYVTEQKSKGIYDSCCYLEKVIDCSVDIVSYHCPLRSVVNGKLFVDSKINTYAEVLMHNYISDSKGCFSRNPLSILDYSDSFISQFVIHPIWWDFVSKSPTNNLYDFLSDIIGNNILNCVHGFDGKINDLLPNVSLISNGSVGDCF